MAPLSPRAVAATLLLFHVVVFYNGPAIPCALPSGCYCWRDCKSELGSLFPKTHLSSAKRVLLRSLKNFLPVGFFGRQQMEGDSSELMRSSRNRLCFSEPARNAAEELAQIVVSVMQGISTNS